MYFHTWSFAVFFLIAYVAYVLLRPTRFAMPCLLGASYIFYAWGKPSAATAVLYLILIFYVSLFDYLAVLLMSLTGRRKFFLVLSLLNGITLLALFKYGAFVSEAVNSLLSLLGIPYHLPAPDLFVPVGLSFYIFQSMTYTIDCYRGRIPREKSFLRYAAFIAFFPRLLAGPIERAARFLPQLAKRPRISMNDVADGASLFIVGLFKKLALADYLALYVNNVYDAPHRFGSPALALAAFLFSWQIYFDFSGYSDMARGLARMMGMRVMLNFNNPYLATGLSDFWRRWHISLSSWFRDYLYIPLGGNRRGTTRTYCNITAVMLVSGLWHAGVFSGTALTFLVWALLHAAAACATYNLEKSAFYRRKIPRLLKQLFVFVFVTFAWIFFRAATLGEAWAIIAGIFTAGFADPRCPLLGLIMILAVWLYQFAYESRLRTFLELCPVRIGTVVLMILYLAVFAPSSPRPFIYLQF